MFGRGDSCVAMEFAAVFSFPHKVARNQYEILAHDGLRGAAVRVVLKLWRPGARRSQVGGAGRAWAERSGFCSPDPIRFTEALG